jgi:hypothetical protein
MLCFFSNQLTLEDDTLESYQTDVRLRSAEINPTNQKVAFNRRENVPRRRWYHAMGVGEPVNWRRMMKQITLAAAFLLSLSTLGGCGYRTSDRAISGAGIGAGVGAVGGWMVGAPLEGALIGGAVGAGTGALTSPNQINLGRPMWR